MAMSPFFVNDGVQVFSMQTEWSRRFQIELHALQFYPHTLWTLDEQRNPGPRDNGNSLNYGPLQSSLIGTQHIMLINW